MYSFDIVFPAKQDRHGNISNVVIEKGCIFFFTSFGLGRAAFEVDRSFESLFGTVFEGAVDRDSALCFFADVIDVIKNFEFPILIGEIDTVDFSAGALF